MYRVIFCQDLPGGSYRVLAKVETLEEARFQREVSGDLVVDDDGQIVTDAHWLFQWERNDPSCYAYRQIMWQRANPYWNFLVGKYRVP